MQITNSPPPRTIGYGCLALFVSGTLMRLFYHLTLPLDNIQKTEYLRALRLLLKL